jgi:thiol:disulfide interchange protein DsbA
MVFARPGSSGPTVLVIHDRWGLDEHVRLMTQRLGDAGFNAAAVALFDATRHGDDAEADKKVEVLEFFWYGCPHCYTIEPLLDSWSRRLPPDVAFRKVHVGFSQVHQIHQKIFYALEEMGQLPAMHRKVFAAIHQQNRRLTSESDIAALMKENGVDPVKFLEVYKSFSVNTRAARARQITDAYKIDGVPAMGVQGRFWTSGGLAGSHERMLQVVDVLIQRSRT